MSDQSVYGPAQRHGNWEYCEAKDRTNWKRKVKADGTRTAWEPVSPPLAPEPSPLLLILVRESQAEGEPKHWSLFVGREGQPGSVYQVTGDATFMERVFDQNKNILDLESYHSSYVMCQLGEGGEALVRDCAEQETPPRAETRALVTENCQGWSVRVLKRLQQAGIVGEEAVTLAKGLQEPV